MGHLDLWTTYGDVTPAFYALAAMPDARTIDEWMQPLHLFGSCCTIAPTQRRVRTRQGNSRSATKAELLMVCIYTVCTHPTHQDSCLPGWSLFGPNDDPCSTASVTSRMGLKQKPARWMEHNLDEPIRSIRILQGTLAMWLQERLQSTLQNARRRLFGVQLLVIEVDNALM